MKTLISGTAVAKSVPFDNSTNGFVSTNTQAAIEEAKTLANASRFTLTLLNNATLLNGQRVTYSDLLPTTQVLVPTTCKLRAVSFANSVENPDWSFEFRNYTAASNYTSFTSLFTWSGSTQVATREDRSDDFAVADEIRVLFTDTGTNPSDLAMVLFFLATVGS